MKLPITWLKDYVDFNVDVRSDKNNFLSIIDNLYQKVLSIIDRLFDTTEENLKNEIKNDIAAEFYTENYILKDWIMNLRILRNIVAHGGRLYGTNMRFRPQKCPNGHCLYYPETGKVFDQLYMLKIMHFDILEWQYCVSRINEIIENYSEYISLSEIGFHEDWLEKLES